MVAPNLGSLERLLRLLPEDQYYVSRDAALQAYGAETLFNVIELESAWKIDLIMRKSREFSRAEFDRRVRVELAGAALYIATAEDVLLAKLEWAKLCESERQLEDAAGILRVQGEALDLEHVDRWARALDLSAELAAAKTRAEP